MFSISDEQGDFLVKYARQVIEFKLGLSDTPVLIDLPPQFSEKCGVFVTLNLADRGNHGLRGCIGLPYPTKPLIEAVHEAAESAAFSDPRFPPVRIEEMENITVEISVLTPPEKIEIQDRRAFPEIVKVGRDGLIIGRGWSRGLLLPQVPVDWGWDSEEFLTQCCIKAGLPPDSWLLDDTEVFKFEAIVYGEEQPQGKVKRHL